MYVAEGDLLKRSYTVSRNGTQVAQVHPSYEKPLLIYTFHAQLLCHIHYILRLLEMCKSTLASNTCLLLQVMYDENARAAVTSKHSYAVQVAPGTDCVLMITAAMAIEDIYHA